MHSAADGKDKINSANKLPKDSEYICELCMERFDDSNKLQGCCFGGIVMSVVFT
jgi:hypothetical protein